MKNSITKSTVVILLSIFALSFFCSFTSAQVASYTFSQSIGTFTPVLPFGQPANIFFPSWDDQVSSSIPIGFPFNFAGTDYTSTIISTNGFLVFGSTLINNVAGGAYVSASDPSGLYLDGTSSNNGIAGMNMNWQEQTFANFTGTIALLSFEITDVSSFANLQLGMRLSGNGIQSGSIITAMNPEAATITMSIFALQTFTTTVTPSSFIIATTTGCT